MQKLDSAEGDRRGFEVRPAEKPKTVLGRRVQRALERAQWTRVDLARRWGVQPSTVTRALRQPHPTQESLARFAELLTELGDPCRPSDLEVSPRG